MGRVNDYNSELPPISFITNTISQPAARACPFNFTNKVPIIISSSNKMQRKDDVVTSSPIRQSMENDLVCNKSELRKSAENMRVDRSFSEVMVESDEDMIMKENKKPKLRIQPYDKTKHLLKLNRTYIDSNSVKRKEIMRQLKQTQANSLKHVKVVDSIKSNQRFNLFAKEVENFCSRNQFFAMEYSDKQIKVTTILSNNFIVVFNASNSIYENWGFQKPTLMGKEIIDKQLLERMKRSPSIETLMNELFRICCNTACECLY